MKLLDNPAPNSAENVLLKRTVSKRSLWKMELMEKSVVRLSHEVAAQSSVKMLMLKFELIGVFPSRKLAETCEKVFIDKVCEKACEKNYRTKSRPEAWPKSFGKKVECNPYRKETVQKRCTKQCQKISIAQKFRVDLLFKTTTVQLC